MRRCFLLANEVLERLTVDDSMVNIILGTGVLAREMQGKLQLLNLKAPLLIGFEDDSEKGVLGYENLDRLEESESCRFISCMDIDEFALIGPSHSAVRKLLGSALTNNPRFITFSSQPVIGERTPDLRTDVSVQSCRLRDGCPFTVDGDTGDKSAFKIHILGACTASDIYTYADTSISYHLHNKLKSAGFNACVFSWGQEIRTPGDDLILFLRDVRFHKPDLVVILNSLGDAKPVRATGKNTLAVRNDYMVHYSVRIMTSSYDGDVSNGIDHGISPSCPVAVQSRIFEALSRHLSFAFWQVIPPFGAMMAEERSRLLTGLSPGYLARERDNRDDIVKKINSPGVKDYTGIFDNEPDIFSFFVDISHFTNKGNAAVASKLAEDILAEFGAGKYEKKG